MNTTSTTTTASTLTAREYLRVSYDKSGRERSNDEQHADNVRDAEAHGWRLGKPYRDTGSASRYAAKRRDDFDRLVADLDAGRFEAQVLILWESSRGSRRLSEWAAFLELLEERGVLVHVTSHGHTYDLSRPRDRRSLQEDGTDAEYESGKLSTRARRATAANAKEGKPHGRIPFGYRRRYEVTPSGQRVLIAQEPDPDEAPVIVELFERLNAGHSLRAISRDFTARGIRSRSGIVLTSESLRSMALRPLYAGYRSHVAGNNMTKKERLQRSALTDATWPALVEPATFQAVQARLNDPTRRTSRPGRARHLLSLIAVCDVCGGPVAARYGRGVRQYHCQHGGHVRIDADALDAYAEDELMAYLLRPENVAHLTDTDVTAELAEARAEVSAVRALHDDLADQVGRGDLTPAFAARSEPGILARLAEAERKVEVLTTPSALVGLVGSADDVETRWADMPMSARREVARLLLAPGARGELRVMRSPSRGHAVPAAERVTFGHEQSR